MQLPKPLHAWDVSPADAIALQKKWGQRIILEPLKKPVRLIAGLDAAFSKDGTQCIAGVVLWDIHDHTPVEYQVATAPVTFPYIPGLLSFREMPALLKALAKLRQTPDVLMCDGQGIAHPRRMGIASHLGLWLDMPSVGCGKSRLFGLYEEPEAEVRAKRNLTDRGQTIGIVLRTKLKVKPVFISPGHRLTVSDAEQLVLACVTRYRLPEPTRLADRLVAEAKVERWITTLCV